MPVFSKGDVVRFQALDAAKPQRVDLVIIQSAEFGKVMGWRCCRKDNPDIGPVGTFNESTLRLQQKADAHTIMIADAAAAVVLP